MVFIYLPFYFGIGVIVFFVLRWALLSWKRYGPPRPPAARAVDAGGPDARLRTGNAAGVLVVALVAAVVVGLVGFAIGRATLEPSAFDLPIGWGPLGFAIPAAIVGALTAAFSLAAQLALDLLPPEAPRRAPRMSGCDWTAAAH
jgi:hypothetical protein